MTPPRTRTEAEDNAALAEEAARLEAKGVVSEPETVEPPPPPPWTPSRDTVPHWVVGAERVAWKVDALPTGADRTEAPRAQWTGGDVDYRYFKGGHVLATFRPDSKHGAVFGVLKTEPVAVLDADPEPSAA